jgi:hypothetical protein
MVHFSLRGQDILLGKDEWVHATAAAERLDRERRQVEQRLTETSIHERYNVPTLEEQKAALDAAIALCERQAGG